MSISERINHITSTFPETVKLIAVSKTHPAAAVQEAYDGGQRIFGENKVQEMAEKYDLLPKDIQWHLIGHLQTNKVKYIAPFVAMIHSIDSIKLLKEVDKRAKQNDRVIDCLLQVYIADEETKFGLLPSETRELLVSDEFATLKNVRIVGLMAMATFTEDLSQIEREFASLKKLFEELSSSIEHSEQWQPKEISMGMSSDYELAIKHGSTLVRIGSSIFGARDYGQA
ncbi:MAG: YggS family pyridoxal phosphate-dependent enzyme [Salibacteraceae bacterium]|nr:YggS family pyridoxal phosphate-dependent enzyme [Salibacteraceae bacterium]